MRVCVVAVVVFILGITGAAAAASGAHHGSLRGQNQPSGGGSPLWIASMARQLSKARDSVQAMLQSSRIQRVNAFTGTAVIPHNNDPDVEDEHSDLEGGFEGSRDLASGSGSDSSSSSAPPKSPSSEATSEAPSSEATSEAPSSVAPSEAPNSVAPSEAPSSEAPSSEASKTSSPEALSSEASETSSPEAPSPEAPSEAPSSNQGSGGESSSVTPSGANKPSSSAGGARIIGGDDLEGNSSTGTLLFVAVVALVLIGVFFKYKDRVLSALRGGNSDAPRRADYTPVNPGRPAAGGGRVLGGGPPPARGASGSGAAADDASTASWHDDWEWDSA